MDATIVKELRQQFNDLVDVLDSEGFCISRECMCDTSAPIVKLNAAITQLEQDETITTQEAIKSGAGV